MGRTLHIAVALILIALVTACSSTGDKWSKSDSMANESSMNSGDNWQKDSESSEATKKASSSYWKEEGKY